MQSKKLNEKIKDKKIILDFAMRYGNPSIKSKMYKLHSEGCENILVLPLYPQYAAATTARFVMKFMNINENEMATKFANYSTL